MDPSYNGLPRFMNELDFDTMLPNSPYDQFSLDFDYLSSNQISMPSEPEQPGDRVPLIGVSADGEGLIPNGVDSPTFDDGDFLETVCKYANQMILEENVEQMPIMFHDPLALRATEKSFYDAIGKEYPSTPNQQPLYFDRNVEGRDFSANSDPPITSIERVPSVSRTSVSSDSVPVTNSAYTFGGGMSESSANQFLAQNIFTDTDSVLQFQRGVEEANKFLPKFSLLVFHSENTGVAPGVEGRAQVTAVIDKKDGSEVRASLSFQRGRRNSENGTSERKNSPNRSKGRTNHEREDGDSEEGRSRKQSAVYKGELVEEERLSDFFDKVLLSTEGVEQHSCGDNVDVRSIKCKSMELNGQKSTSNGEGGKPRAKKQGKKKETVDLRNLLILCAQALSANDFRAFTEQLKKIRQHSSPLGDGTQRLAHFFANGLEARMAGTGTGTQIFYSSLASKQTSAVEILKAYQVSLSSCPFNRMSFFFQNKMILKMAEKATTVHIVDFGITYGFQWPMLIQKLSMRPGGPPKLRITGIEFPQPGFRPAEWLVETGRRLAKYCERFKVPFEFNAIASKNWEHIHVEDLKVERNEVLAVNCMARFKNLLDETVEVNCPRDSVLKLIRSLKPDIFVFTIINGAYNAPFFVTRFREALFHFSSLYDVFDVNIPRESPERLMFEAEFYGREVMNVIACEGIERVERAETYRQWQVRCQRAGLQLLPLDTELVKAFRDKIKEWYHKDFSIDQDSNWMLQGWKGRTVYASSCWVPV